MSDPSVIPMSMRRCLERYVARRRIVALLTRAGLACSFAIFALLACAIVDRIFPLPTPVRAILGFVNVSVVLVLLFDPVRATLFRRVDWRAAAAQVERRDPRFLGRLETAVSQLLSPMSMQGSLQLVNRVVAEADAVAAEKCSSPLVPMAPALRAWVPAVALALLAFCLRSNAWLDLPTLLKRQLLPLSPVSAVTTTRIFIEPGDVEVPQGESCQITARVERAGAEPPTIRLSSGGHEFSAQVMTPVDADRFTFTLNDIDRDWQYDVSSGDARSETYQLRVQRRPGVMQFRVRYVFPGYMRRAPSTTISDDGSLEAPVGTQATIDLVCTEPIESATILVNGQQVRATPTNAPNLVQVSFAVTQSGPYEVRLVGARGAPGIPPRNAVIHAIPDETPKVAWLEGASDLRLDPFDRLRLQFRASDDYGVVTGALLVDLNEQPVRRIPLKQIVPIALNLAEWNLSIGDVIRVRAEATDAGGQTGISLPISVIIAPASVDEDQLACATELTRAAELSNSIVSDWDEAQRSDDRSPNGTGVFGRNTHLVRCGAALQELQARLLRAVSRNHNENLSPLLASVLDDATICQIAAAEALSSDNRIDATSRHGAMVRAGQLARAMRDSLRLLAPSEEARCLQTDLLNLRALLDRADSLDPARARPLRQALDLAGRNLDARIARLGIEPDDDRLMELLHARIAAADAEIQSTRRIDWASAAHASETELSQRLLWAGRETALRAKPDCQRACDLELASLAIRNGMKAEVIAAIEQREKPQTIRDHFQKRLPPDAELQAFQSAAAERPIAIDVPATQSSQLAVRQQKLAAEIREVEAALQADHLRGPDPTASFMVLGRLDGWRIFSALTPTLRSLRQFMISRAPLDAAMFYTDRSKDLLARRANDVDEIEECQRLAIESLRIAADRAAEERGRERILSTPAVASALENPQTMSASSTPPPQTASPPTNPSKIDAESSNGFDEALRLYFKVLGEHR